MHQDPRTLFPLGKAYGAAFCNRVTETRWLANNLKNSKHSLLLAPRRYGKSSLAEKAINETKYPFAKINFHLCDSEQDVANLILSGVTNLIGQSVGHIEKIAQTIKKYATNLHPKLSFAHDSVALELIPQKQENLAVAITEGMLLLDKLLKEKNHKSILFLDEFQALAKIKKNSNLEGAVRTAAQELQNITIVFSGSERSLLTHMFDDEARPLYKLCRKLKLDRIGAIDYENHINSIAANTWGKKLSEPVFNSIMQFTGRHPYYVNYLCDIIWEECTSVPVITDVSVAWKLVVEEEWSDAIKEFTTLSLNQRKILKHIATSNPDNLFSHQTSTVLSMPSSTIASSVHALIENDCLELDTETHSYRIINPVLRSTFAKEFLK